MKSNNNISAVIFDMDGVLLDTETICFKAWQRYAQEAHLENWEEINRLCLGCNKTDTKLIIQKFYDGKCDADKFLLRTGELFKEIEEEEGISLMPGVIQTLDALKKAGIDILLASSTREAIVRRQLTELGLIQYFSSITAGDMVVHSKPEPDIYLKALASRNLNPENTVAVEDSPNGIRSAAGAGIRCIMVPDKIEPTDELKNLAWKICKPLPEILTYIL